ncbi:Branched-chain-amino-acid transaminase 1 [Candidatus Ornithobacterium hominis]|uniref:Branched-chain-amino-acid aminotransferase n=1 Tax=Candidatus Ornithobacterium hominis TaxID=2497989 RepID=A0A383TUX1_9FLAO|nr:branched-chain amino acid aminotransferase [Candidatus Ornithobacterium hominis]MCT7904537.1 branched-chain amino acid aminotransferase [Candidatus Ornithobacterium hominis]SZD71434.1 Branched-chain-amino-acid transaminase 1 [Candidatus Ornithobacterium hominis]
MRIENIEKTRLTADVFEEKNFGSSFSDHMLVCEFKENEWQEPVIKPYGQINFTPAMHALHYGQACFEGMKAFKGENGDVFLFRPEKNFERINKSAERLAMPAIPKEIFLDGLKALIDLDRAWVPSKYGMSLYIRPVIFSTEEIISARGSNSFMFVILTSIAPDYYNKPLRVKVADHYSRAANGGVGYAKAAGNYGASFYPTGLAKEEGFDQVIWTDAATHSYFEEAGTMNIFVRIEDKLLTAPISDRILNGVTRDSLILLAEKNGMTVEQRPIEVSEVYEANQNGSLKEVFGCGTAVVLNNFSAIGYTDKVMELPEITEESWGPQLKKQMNEIQYGIADDPFGWRVLVERK